ncbi:MAG TPA: DUF2304 domain-containing protein [Bryobacteraceae bacterium]|jgi:hypothetical protein|nr:DUF2304 domain-containing protein [Bryobacteraceae bacterium]
MNHLQLTITVLSLVLMGLVLFSVRRAHIRVEYSVSWLGAGLALLLVSRSRTFLEWLTRVLGLGEPAVALILVAFGVFLVVFYRFSVIISQLKDANIALTQRLAIVEFQLKALDETD